MSRALAGLRDRGWDAPRVQVTIRKQIPVAAGMGGGSADAAAVLRMAARLARIDDSELAELAAGLGSDVPSQLAPGLVLGTGAGDEVELREPLAAHAFVIVPLPHHLSTASVYAEADRLGLRDNELEFAARLPDLWSSLSPGQRLPARLLVNDLEPAATSLCPDIEPALAAVREAGADHAFVSGSGPTVAGLFWDVSGGEGRARAQAAAAALAPRYPAACCAVPVPRRFRLSAVRVKVARRPGSNPYSAIAIIGHNSVDIHDQPTDHLPGCRGMRRARPARLPAARDRPRGHGVPASPRSGSSPWCCPRTCWPRWWEPASCSASWWWSSGPGCSDPGRDCADWLIAPRSRPGRPRPTWLRWPR